MRVRNEKSLCCMYRMKYRLRAYLEKNYIFAETEEITLERNILNRNMLMSDPQENMNAREYIFSQ